MQTRRAVLARGAGATMVALGLMLILAAAASAAPPSKRLLIPSAGWHGRAIQEPHRHDAQRTGLASRALRGWSAGGVSLGTGLHRASGDAQPARPLACAYLGLLDHEPEQLQLRLAYRRHRRLLRDHVGPMVHLSRP